jgi:hypothetical protein
MSMAEASVAVSKLKVFVSYARSDASAFVEDLVAGLKLVGFDPVLDRHDIAAGEDWETRLSGLIHAADTIVFVVTPQAVKSKRCAWEVEHTVALSKRVIPVVAVPVDESEVPGALKRLNYIFFNEPHTFARALGQLSDALRTDLDWIREHTRLAELATRWKDRGRDEALLLRGAELEAANTWIAGWKSGAPEVSALHRDFIGASEEALALRRNAERQQLEEMANVQSARAAALADREAAVKALSRRTAAGIAGASVLTAVAGGLAYWGNDAERRFKAEKARAEEADKKSTEEAIRQQAARTDIEGQLSAFAASAGQEAADGPAGGNSPYTEAVLKGLADPDASLQSALARAHYHVLKTSPTKQRPFLATDMNGDIYLLRPAPGRRLKAIVISVDNLGQASNRLPNVANDAKLWGESLKKTGFEVTLLLNPNFEDWKSAMARTAFEDRADRPAKKQGSLRHSLVTKVAIGGSKLLPVYGEAANTLLLFFFAGAGLYYSGSNYLLTNDSYLDVSDKNEMAVNTFVPVSKIQEWARDRAAASVIVLDTNFTDLSKLKAITRPGEEHKSIWDPTPLPIR